MNKKTRYNKYENIEIKSFYDIEDVNALIDEKVKGLDEDDDLVVYAKRDLVAALFINMIENDYDFGYMDFDRIDDLLKNEVYIMTVSNDRRVNIEHVYNNGKVVLHDSKIALFYTDDCKQDIIDRCIDNDMEVILFDFEGDEGYCEEECTKKLVDDKCHNAYSSESVSISKSENDVPKGFSKSWHTEGDGISSQSSYSFFSNNLDLVKNMAEKFGVVLLR